MATNRSEDLSTDAAASVIDSSVAVMTDTGSPATDNSGRYKAGTTAQSNSLIIDVAQEVSVEKDIGDASQEDSEAGWQHCDTPTKHILAFGSSGAGNPRWSIISLD